MTAELEAENLRLREQVHELQEALACANARAEVADDVMAQIRSITATQSTWEVQSLLIKQKWEGLLQAARHELRMAQKGLTSGCGCPVGQCLGATRGAACWKQWALSSAMVQACNTHMDALRTDSVHPRRFTNG